MSEIGRTAVMERAKALGWPAVASHGSLFGIAAGEESWRLRIAALSEAELREASRLLGELEERKAREADSEARRADAERPLEDDEPAAIELRKLIKEADEIAARAELPATRGQIDRLINIMEDIRDSLHGRAK